VVGWSKPKFGDGKIRTGTKLPPTLIRVRYGVHSRYDIAQPRLMKSLSTCNKTALSQLQACMIRTLGSKDNTGRDITLPTYRTHFRLR